ncbi:F-box/kelch-repeat protein At3g23880-like [Castanea sativa]|uniref:F-box/kelch-repeat protein At3g23880-like n=1 Tax=Castanea sativa TaxID=21020 RepID=UPI003F64D57D
MSQRKHVPYDIIITILPKLPIKSIVRFRCVCKLWDSTITSSAFISTHLSNNNNNNVSDHGYLIHMPNVITKEATYSSSSSSSSLSNPVCMVACDPKFNKISEYRISSDFSREGSCNIVGSCNGVLCLADSAWNPTYLWNPSIRKFKSLPCLSKYQWVSAGFAYQSETNDYKVIKIYSTSEPYIERHAELQAEVYTLSSDEWRRVGIPLNLLRLIYPTSCSSDTFVSGALHWVAWIKEDFGSRSRKILSFDVNNEKFGEIAIPYGGKIHPQILAVIKENLAFISSEFCYASGIRYGIWVMGEYGVCESWNKLFTLRLGDFEFIIGCTRHGEVIVRKNAKTKSDAELQRGIDFVVVIIDPVTLNEKELIVPHFPTKATTFVESLVLLDDNPDKKIS